MPCNLARMIFIANTHPPAINPGAGKSPGRNFEDVIAGSEGLKHTKYNPT